MLAAMRCVLTDEPRASTRFCGSPAGEKIGRMMLGPAAGTAVKLDGDGAVGAGLAVGEGIETCLAGRQMGFCPAWALGSTSNITTLPVLPGVETLTLFAEAGEASAKAVEACGDRWHEAGREVLIVRPCTGSDLNDALREVA